MSQKPKLLVDFCSHQAAKYAVEHWHYSKVMPAGKLVKFGVWEDNRFIGAVIYGRGANKFIGSPYGVSQTEVVELVRVALKEHKMPVTKIVSLSLKLLKQNNSGLRLIVSYADTKQEHIGIIYQAGNWIYEGSSSDTGQRIHGTLVHRRSVYSKYGRQDIAWLQKNIDPNAEWVSLPPKHKYLYPLDKAMRRQIEPLAKPYPKRASVGEMESR